MLIKNYQMTFFCFLIMGTILAVSANSWFTCWLGLEINLMGLIPLILFKLNTSSTEAAIKYFLVQAMASVFLIFFSCFEVYMMNLITASNLNIIIFIALATKAGLAPFHFWFPQVMMTIPWIHCIILLTWQKIAPFILLSYFSSKYMIYAMVSISALVGAYGGLNQLNLKIILTYSSIAHSSWMLMLSSISIFFWMNYFMVYTIISLSIIIPLMKFNLILLQDIKTTKMNILSKLSLISSLLSLGGMPPFLGFTAKFLALLASIPMFSLYIISILILSSLLSLFYYMKLIYSFMFILNKELNFPQKNLVKNMNIWASISIFCNLSIPLFILFF
uniref:NADH-ubiquinone oxidoreductase chain 2 n=1 Tax=Cryptopygus terranovus TaxID=1906390 RepID=A0A343A7X2_9HEXA|nr:NADH dehydrogenase subunit 2 [Cryptopygus terranovus]APC61717.1 NADH dehydrogenase subunit 2 [Cryptopygus terranovus]